MKIVAFCGSARKQGNAYLLQKAVLEPLADAGADTEIVELAGNEIKGCMSCYVCFLEKNGHMLQRKIGAAVVAVRRSGAVYTLETMNHFFLLSKMVIVGSNFCSVGICPEKGEVVDDEEGMKNMRLLSENMMRLLKRIHA